MVDIRHMKSAMQFSPTSRLNYNRQGSKQTLSNISVHVWVANGDNHNRRQERWLGDDYVRRTEIPAAGPLVKEHGALKLEIFVQKSKICGPNVRQ